MSDIENLEKRHEQDKKTIRNLTAEKQKLYQRVQLLLKENQSLRVLAKLPEDNNAARRVAKSELEKEYHKKARHLKRKAPAEYYSSEEDSEDEVERYVPVKKQKKKKKVKFVAPESESEDEESSDSDDNQDEEKTNASKKKQNFRLYKEKTKVNILKL